jgi:hypothetical protein
MAKDKGNYLSADEKYLLDVTQVIMMTLYTAVMVGILHNFFRFIVKDGRWKQVEYYDIAPFYLFAFFCVGLRMVTIVGYNRAYSEKITAEECTLRIGGCPIKNSTIGYEVGNITMVSEVSIGLIFGFFYAC